MRSLFPKIDDSWLVGILGICIHTDTHRKKKYRITVIDSSKGSYIIYAFVRHLFSLNFKVSNVQ